MPKKKKWTVLVYMAGDNNLSAEMVYGLKEMRRVAATEEFKREANLIAQFDPRGGTPRVFNFEAADPKTDGDLDVFGKELNREEISGIIRAVPKSDRDRPHLQEVLESLRADQLGFEGIETALVSPGDRPSPLEKAFDRFKNIVIENSAAPEVVQGFLDSHIRDDAQEYVMVVLSGHGSGALGDFLRDDQSQSSLGIPKLAAILDRVRKAKLRDGRIDILGMDSCLMSMAELAFELSGSARCLVGAEGFVPNTGWPYHRILEAVLEPPDREKPASEPERLALAIVEKYSLYYRDYEVAGLSTDLAACDPSRLTDLVGEFAKLTKVLLDEIGVRDQIEAGHSPILDAILPAHHQAQSYKNEQYVDLWDFCDRLAANLTDESDASKNVRRLCGNVKSRIVGGVYRSEDNQESSVQPVVLRSCNTGARFQHSHGLSIYFPWSASGFIAAYNNLRFAGEKGTRWGEFLEKYLKATRRERRDQGANLEQGKPKPPLRFGEPGDIVPVKFGTDDSAKFGTDDSAKFGTDDSAKWAQCGQHDEEPA